MSRETPVGVRIGAYGVGLALALGAAYGVGKAVGPVETEPAAASHDDTGHDDTGTSTDAGAGHGAPSEESALLAQVQELAGKARPQFGDAIKSADEGDTVAATLALRPRGASLKRWARRLIWTAERLVIAWRVWPSMVVSSIAPVAGLSGIWPEQNTSEPVAIA